MQTKPQEYDVIVVGSGASGGWAAKRMAEAGMRVALVCAGRPLTDGDYSEHKPAFDLKYRGRANDLIRRSRPTQKDCYACTEYNADWFCNDLEEPYTTATGKPFSWQGRMRVTGGRTNVWGRQSYRFSQQDMKGASFDGHGIDWPLDYKDIEPYYDLVEDYVGISGLAEHLPELPDSRFQPAMAFTCAEEHARTAIKSKLGRTLTIGRVANLTTPINGRAKCHFCGPCERGCVTHSYFNSAFTTVADAIKTGRCTHIPNAMVYQVLMDNETNRARGVVYIDRVTRQVKEVTAKTVVLCAQALESARILLNSSSSRYGAGLANSSGALGHYLMDHMWVAGGGSGEFPGSAGQARRQRPSPAEWHLPGALPQHRRRAQPQGLHPRLRLSGQQQHQLQLRRRRLWRRLQAGGDDRQLGSELRRFRRVPALLRELHRDRQVRRRRLRHPGAEVIMAWGENEKKMIRDMGVSAGEMLEAAGAKNVRTFAFEDRVPGFGIHEIGVARMGADPKTSVLNQFQQTHDVKNLFVMDGASFPPAAARTPPSPSWPWPCARATT